MKPASIIVLIIATLLVICGIILCLLGNSIAKKDNIELFPQVRDGIPYLKQEFSADMISKIELDINDATVNITGGDITSSVEFTNYNPNLYDLDVTSQTISFNEAEGIKSLFNIWENGFGFKGYRNLLNFSSLKSKGDKEVNLHLGDTSLISSIVIKGKNLKINIENAQIKKELRIEADSVMINSQGFTAGNGVYLTSASLDSKFTSLACGMLKIETDSAKVSSTSSDIRQTDIKTETGSVTIENVSRGDEAEFDISTKSLS